MTTTRIRALRVNTTLIGAAFVTLLGAAAKGDTIDVFSTGNGNETCGDADANWTVSSGGSGGQTFILNSNCANWFSSWAADTASSSWIGATDTNPTPTTPVTFTETFSMSGLDTSTAVIKGTWYSDDQSTFYVNDDGIDTQNDTFNGVAFSIPDEDLVSGLNTLTIVMTSDDLTDDGIRVEFSQATANSLSPVPEPNSILLLAGLALGIGWRSRCQRRKIN